MSSDAENCVGFSVVKLEPHKHVMKLGRSGWIRGICCLRDSCGVTARVSTSEHQLLAVVTLALLPIGKWRLPTGKDVFVCNRFPQTETALGLFPWIHQKEQKNFP